MNNPPQIELLESPEHFPDTRVALQTPNGLLAASRYIDSDWLVASYRRGIFPWYSPGEPVLWWSPSPRAVLYTREFIVRRSLRKALAKNARTPSRRVTLNHAFEQVMRQCAQPRTDGHGTWITEDIVRSYTQLHRRGLAHSVELWEADSLIGGLYCVSMGQMVFGESMFARVTDASKIAFAHFVRWLEQQNVRIIDCQQATQHLQSLGAKLVDRENFETELQAALGLPALDWTPQILECSNDSSQ